METKIPIRKETDKDQIHSFLETDRIWAGYAICDLEPEMFPLCDWYTAHRNNDIISLCLHFKGLQPPTQITIGEPFGVERILKTADVPREVYAHIPITHLEIVRRSYYFGGLRNMKRMVVTKESFKPVAGNATKMNPGDLMDLEQLYAIQSETFFRPYMLASGVYYGLKKNNTLVSAAGTHVCSSSYGLACVGNIFTLPSHQRKGYATICTSQVVKELLTCYNDVILNVASDNTPAIKIYRRLGFHEQCTYLEGLGKLKQDE